MKKSRLLLDEKPLIILPELAKKIGLNEAIVLQQINYWLVDSTHIYDGRKWVYNTYGEWQKQLPFWSINTIRRSIAKLETLGLVISGNFNKMKLDNTKWYTIDYDEVYYKFDTEPIDRYGQTTCPNWADGNTNLGRPIPEISTETSSNNIYIPYQEIIEYLNLKAGTKYKHTSNATRKLIQTRWKDKFTLDDFKKVIDNKVSDWLGNKEYEKYLRPETLFGTKFEGYLNKPKGQPNQSNNQQTPNRSDLKPIGENDPDFMEFMRMEAEKEAQRKLGVTIP